MQHVLRILSLAVSLLAGIEAGAQFKYFTTEGGLPSNTVYCLFQDSGGVIWAGTANGLCRQNGIGFGTFDLNPEVISKKNIYSICESPDDNVLWIGCNEGLFSLDRNMNLKKIDLRPDNGPELGIAVYRVLCDSEGNIWVGTYGNGIFRYDRTGGVCESYGDLSRNSIIQNILMSRDNVVWISTDKDNCLYRYNSGRDSFNRIPIADKFTKEEIQKVTGLCQDSFGDIWISGANSELFRLSVSDMQCVRFRQDIIKGALDVRTIREATSGNLVIGTDAGLLGFDCNDFSFTLIDDGNVRNDGKLNDKFVHSLLYDSQGGLWVGTYFGGVNYKASGSETVKRITPPSGCGRIISSLYEIERSVVIVGSDDGGLSLYNYETEEYRPLEIDRNNSHLNVHCIFEDGNDIWIGTYGGGLYRVDHEFNLKHRYDEKSVDSGDLNVYSAIKDRFGRIWMGTPNGLCQYNKEEDRFIRALYLEKGSDITDMVEWDNSLYLASQGRGLIRLDYNSGEFEFLSEDRDGPKRISNIKLLDGTLYIGSYGGFYTFNGDTFSKCGDENLSKANITSQAIDHGSLWIGTTHGLFHYGTDGEVTRYGTESGLLSGTFNINSCLILSNGDILMGCERGINLFKGSALSENVDDECFRTVITDFNIMAGKGREHTRMSCLEDIVIRENHATFTIGFSALNYRNPYKNIFRYRLAGYDRQWNYTLRDKDFKDIIYSGIPTGHYTFEVQSAPSANAPYGEPATLNISVKRTFLNTLAILLAHLAGLGLLFFLYFTVSRSRRKMKISLALGENLKKLHKGSRADAFCASLTTSLDEALASSKRKVDIKADVKDNSIQVSIGGDGKFSRDLSFSLDNVSENEIGKINPEDNFTKMVCEIIRGKISDPELSVDDISAEMNVSRATIFNRIKASLGTTPNHLIRDIRLETAAEMLKTPNVRISEVYYKVGFTSGSYFSKLFHERYGQSPKEFNR